MNVNVGNIERIIRTVVSIGIITAISLTQVSPWLALVATYPFFTALFQWDPFYALIQAISYRQDTSRLRSNATHRVSA